MICEKTGVRLSIIHTACHTCKTSQTLYVPYDGLVAWLEGELIQKALPTLTDNEREILKSNTCGKCWDKMFEEIPEQSLTTAESAV